MPHVRLAVVATLVVAAVASSRARAERGHQAYERMLDRERHKKLEATIAAAYSCKRRGTPLLVVDTTPPPDSADAPTRLSMYRGGAVELTTSNATVTVCVDRRVNDWVRWQLANVSWRTKRAPKDCAATPAPTTRFTVSGRERFNEQACGVTLASKSRARLVEIEAVLHAAVRKAVGD
jgi:hypothetical protein